MPIQLPDLAGKTYEDFVDELLASIPNYTDRWTNYNPSDPGITVLELLSWIAEMTLYRIDRMPEESYINFLRLVAGTSGAEVGDILQDLENKPDSDRARIKLLKFLKEIEGGNKKSIPEIKAQVQGFLDSHYRAITKDDFRALSMEATEDEEEAKVKRVIVFEHPDKVEIIIVSGSRDKYDELVKKVAGYLHPRRLIGTRVEVKAPEYTEVRIDVVIICSLHANPQTVSKNVETNIRQYLDPITGGADNEGWAYKRTLTVFEIDHIIEETDGVERAIYVDFKNNKNSIIIDGLIDLKELTVEVKKDKGT
ncbi:Baseplate J-like protein [uncultured archaeon]|nr:Baseplate J-like protein [uncultured archaeon]